MVDELLNWGYGVEGGGPGVGGNMVDVGCGLGGSARHICEKFKVNGKGVTLSPYQARRGNEISESKGLGGEVEVRVEDALNMTFKDDAFDLVWSLESGEHMPDKARFVGEMVRVCKPGGKVLMATWCHRDLEEGESLSRREERCLRRINRCYYLPEWCSGSDYVELFKAHGDKVDLGSIRSADWSYVIAPFWKAVIKSSLNFKSVWGLLKSGPRTIRGAAAMAYMLKGYNMGLIKFALVTVDLKGGEEGGE
ncbi:hypothetical protein TrCOL_g12545 [Triparma columacea]|uniref:Methyltransferase type 11 domain-containing protein n=1 Tax=Triparma columacea TaxID=722753 RepID=A0A9W7G2R4_9STRA|nr:hypothetical protein TrCOL_g12545 [Triparma columacea]